MLFLVKAALLSFFLSIVLSCKPEISRDLICISANHSWGCDVTVRLEEACSSMFRALGERLLSWEMLVGLMTD